MNPQKRCIATKALVLLSALMSSALAYAAQVSGTVTHLSGTLLVKKANGTVKVLSLKSNVEPGDLLISEKDTYARIKFVDQSEITLKPNSQFKIEEFSFEEEAPDKDSAQFNLVKGGLRAVTGMLGKRNRERFGMNTPTATIGIRGTIFVVEYIPPAQPELAAYRSASVAALTPISYLANSETMSDVPVLSVPSAILPMQLAQRNEATPSAAQTRAPGLYVQVIDGMIQMSNRGGASALSAGQFGYAASVSHAPVILPANPGMQFNAPPALTLNTASQGSESAAPTANDVDCEVR